MIVKIKIKALYEMSYCLASNVFDTPNTHLGNIPKTQGDEILRRRNNRIVIHVSDDELETINFNAEVLKLSRENILEKH